MSQWHFYENPLSEFPTQPALPGRLPRSSPLRAEGPLLGSPTPEVPCSAPPRVAEAPPPPPHASTALPSPCSLIRSPW